MLCGREPENEKTVVTTVDITPSWRGLVGHMMLVLETSDNEEAKSAIRGEMENMARVADLYVEEHKDDE